MVEQKHGETDFAKTQIELSCLCFMFTDTDRTVNINLKYNF